jgi:hypothetical protein
VAQETAKATSGKKPDEGKVAKKTEVAQLARDAGNAFVEAQKRLLDVMGQQMNVNLDAATRTIGLVSPSQLLPIATRTGQGVKNFFDSEKSIFGSFIKPSKKSVTQAAKHGRARTTRRPKPVTA